MLKTAIHSLYDTKHIFSQNYPENDSSLSSLDALLNKIDNTVEFQDSLAVEDLDEAETASNELHDAGYDAFLTGKAFAQLKNKLGDSKFSESYRNR